MYDQIMCFVAVEFVDDPNVVGLNYWYLCHIDGVEEGDSVIAPLGRHNNLQQGIVRRVLVTKGYNAPFPLDLIKSIKKVVSNKVIEQHKSAR